MVRSSDHVTLDAGDAQHAARLQRAGGRAGLEGGETERDVGVLLDLQRLVHVLVEALLRRGQLRGRNRHLEGLERARLDTASQNAGPATALESATRVTRTVVVDAVYA